MPRASVTIIWVVGVLNALRALFTRTLTPRFSGIPPPGTGSEGLRRSGVWAPSSVRRLATHGSHWRIGKDCDIDAGVTREGDDVGVVTGQELSGSGCLGSKCRWRRRRRRLDRLERREPVLDEVAELSTVLAPPGWGGWAGTADISPRCDTHSVFVRDSDRLSVAVGDCQQFALGIVRQSCGPP